MTTSANVTHYELCGNDMRMIDTARRHALCKDDDLQESLERWERDYPDALLALRWPDEEEVDQYLTFDELDGYPEDLGTTQYMDKERDMCTLRVFMRRKRERLIASHEGTIEYLRKYIREFRGNQGTKDYSVRKKFHEFTRQAEAEAEELGQNVKARCFTDGEEKFSREFLLTCRTVREVKMAMEAIQYFYSTGRIPKYDEPYPGENDR